MLLGSKCIFSVDEDLGVVTRVGDVESRTQVWRVALSRTYLMFQVIVQRRKNDSGVERHTGLSV